MTQARISRWIAPTLLAACAALAVPCLAQSSNECDLPGEVPDVIVGDIFEAHSWGQISGISSFSIGTYSCNVGTCWLSWVEQSNQHPVIGQNMFRLRDGRFEQLGQSWLKHGFYALSDELCSTGCVETDGNHLGVNCADPYTAGLNGVQNGLGPKFEVDPHRGSFPWPPTDFQLTGNAIYKRLQVRNIDLDSTFNEGARYFVEGQYVTPDDATAGTDDNNVSWREATITASSGSYTLSLIDQTVVSEPAIMAWAQNDPDVRLEQIQVPLDGMAWMGSSARSIGHGWWHYEYAIQNVTSDRAFGAVRIPLPGDAQISGVGFHDVNYHSGEPFRADDWPWTIDVDPDGSRFIEWAVPGDDPTSANALRWGTLYNVRFDASAPPDPLPRPVTLVLFDDGAMSTTVSTTQIVPVACNDDGICDASESCDTCPGDCLAGAIGFCGDGICETIAGEDCTTCAADCNGVQSGTPSNRYCCGGGGGQTPIGCTDPLCTAGGKQCTDDVVSACCGNGTCDAGETACGCAADCGPCDSQCVGPADCDDGMYCNGTEDCVAGACVAGASPCAAGLLCLEDDDTCVECLTDDHCSDDLFCDGPETCNAGSCQAGADPCPGAVCSEAIDLCVECATDSDCDDGVFCNGAEFCSATNECFYGGSPCNFGDVCDEAADTCIVCTIECNDGLYCNGEETCLGDTCTPGVAPCPDNPCDESMDRCLGAVLQPHVGDPLLGLTDDEVARFLAGREVFTRVHAEVDGLGPAFNATSCAGCHVGVAGDVENTLFGHDGGSGSFDPLVAQGGPLLQTQTTGSGCEESLPAEADVVVPRLVTTHLGAGLIDAIPDAAISARADSPPPGISGRVVLVKPASGLTQPRVGRFGAKLERATLAGETAMELRDQLGLTNRIVTDETAPNGDLALLATCDTVADPEVVADPDGTDDLDRLVDYLRLLAPPPQTPRGAMTGSTLFSISGCDRCHVGAFTLPDDPSLPAAMRGLIAKPYSDFLLHDMGPSGDGVSTAGAERNEMRTTPLWGLRHRPRWWHDGRVASGTFAERVDAVVQLHNVAGSEAQTAAQTLLALSSASYQRVVDFLGSLGRPEFDDNDDGAVDAADLPGFIACYGQTSVTSNVHCAVHDHDRDGDVDIVDYQLFARASSDVFGGSVPDGASRPGAPLTVEPAAAGALTLSWGPACSSDDDYEVYDGPIGEFDNYRSALCGTGGALEATITPQPGDRFFLVAPHNGVAGGSLGLESDGAERPATSWVCRPRVLQPCP